MNKSDTDMVPTPLIIPAARLAQDLARARSTEAGRSLQSFIRLYLPQHAGLAFSRMHLELFALLEQTTRKRGLRLAVAAPRGHAKSTVVSLAYVLWCIVYRLEHYILLLSDTADQAANLLSFVKHELEHNALLRADFPQACAVPPAHARPSRWRKHEIITGNQIKLTALGVDSKVRGRRHNQHRPGLIIVDDAENDESVRSEEQRQHLREWFERAVLKAGTPETNTLVMGTILHYAGLLAGLTDQDLSPGWSGRVYRAVETFSERGDLWDRWESIYSSREQHQGGTGPEAAEAFLLEHRQAMLEGTCVLWPEREDYLKLMTLRLCEGRASFDAEKQNQPGVSSDCCFQESDLVYWEGRGPGQFQTEAELLASLSPGYAFIGACDPSLGKAGHNRDDTAIITLVKDYKTKTLYVLEADIRKRRPDQILEALIEYHRQRRYARVVMETNQYQQFLADELRRRSRAAGCPVPVWGVNHTSDKLGRLQKLQPIMRSGMLRFSRRHPQLIDQLLQFPHAAHDDGPDALEMAVSNTPFLSPNRPRTKAVFYASNGESWESWS